MTAFQDFQDIGGSFGRRLIAAFDPIARLRASLRSCGDAFARMSDASLADSVPLGAPGGTGRVVRARSLGLFVTDLAEHDAQVASYMRLMGLVPPSARARRAR